MIRARERLYLLNARRRYMFGQEQYNKVSRFLKDIPHELLDDDLRLLSATGQSPYCNPYLTKRQPPERGDRVSRSQSQMDFATHKSTHNLSAIADAYADAIEAIPEPLEEQEGIYIGMKMRHPKFGVGTIRKVEGEDEGQKVIVWFNSAAPKKLMVRFAGLERA
jgi:DNA helicase-2/ATP-dependent DNA helicase PcrA